MPVSSGTKRHASDDNPDKQPEKVKKSEARKIEFDEKKYYTDELEFDAKDWYKQWVETSDLIRQKKEEITAGLSDEKKEKAVKVMLLASARYRFLNRIVQYQLRKRREELSEASKKCDQDDVQLQNVIYEQRHLAMEADTNLKFKSRHHNFQHVASAEDVIQQAGYSDSAINDMRAEPHKMTLARLELELKKRKEARLQLEDQRKEIRDRQQAVAKKDDTLKNADKQLEVILSHTAGLCDVFDISIDRVQHINKESKNLSPALAHLFKQISQQTRDQYKYLEKIKISTEGEQIFITASVQGEEFFMKFQQNSANEISVACSVPHIASSLFKETEIYGYEEALETASKTKFVKYHWCQNICGIAQLDNKTDKIEGPQMLLKEIDQALEVSVKYESQLKDYFMKKQFAPISKKMAIKMKGCKPFSKIERFEEMNYEKFKNLSLSAAVVREGLARPSQKYYVGRMIRPDIGSKSTQLNFAIAVPYTVGVGCIFCIEQNAKFTANNKLALRLIEGEINNNLEWSTDILADQLTYLAILYDILVETEAVVDGDDEKVTRSKNFNNDIATSVFTTSCPTYDPFSGMFSD